MQNILFFDTETTGLNNAKYNDTHHVQPRAIQLGLKLDDADGTERAALNFLVSGEDWGPHKQEMHPKAFEAHGIPEEISDSMGVHLVSAYEIFSDLIGAADVIVAHNARYDITVMRRMAKVYSEFVGSKYVDPFIGKIGVDTMLEAIPIVKALPKRNGTYKWPRLEECVKHFYDEEMEGAHDALVDVRYTARVYYTLREMGVI